jgi:hypothetical protein
MEQQLLALDGVLVDVGQLTRPIERRSEAEQVPRRLALVARVRHRVGPVSGERRGLHRFVREGLGQGHRRVEGRRGREGEQLGVYGAPADAAAPLLRVLPATLIDLDGKNARPFILIDIKEPSKSGESKFVGQCTFPL